ncbi:glutamine ABC transporter substrate-binding protein GlnH [Paraburkholderia sp. BCC1885]|uniref:glutamine ABC transporter substrate-binding protein GlnH n=1 Tax=Paraburkholderia sp. BCC1885 TaxID=2562669 RepID=UPI00118308F6|nr:glutamine ABC transporter substrate-binding protein GlnH [Paraburkholderia sp. BCC1885]
MRRRVLFKCAVAAALLTSISPSVFAQQDEVVVGCNTSFLPFEFKQGNQYVGFDIDLWTEIARGLGIKWRLQPMDFSGLIPALETRNVDVVLAGLYIRDERKKVIDFSDPYYQSGYSAVVRVDTRGLNTAADLQGKSVGAETGTATVDYLEHSLKNVDIHQYPNIVNALLELQTGRVDAVVHDTPNLLYYANTEGKGKVRLIEPPLENGYAYGIGFQKGSKLVAPVDAELARMKADGRYKQIYRKWFGKDPS